MPIDWEATGSMLSGWGTLAGAGAVAYAAHRAADTLASWKRQRIAERRFDHAEATLAATYKVREAIEIIRSPILHSFETEKAKAELEVDPSWNPIIPKERKDRLYTAQAYIMRIRSTADAWDDLQSVMPLAKALFDDRLEEALAQLLRVRWLLRVNADAYVDLDGTDKDFGVKVRSELCSPLDKGEDAISVSAREQLQMIEDTCLPVLRQ